MKSANFFIICILIVFATACTPTNDPISNSVKTPGSLSVSATTSSYSGKYAPRNVLAIWIESSAGTFVKTLLVNAQERRVDLTNWLGSTSSGNTVDAITGATLSGHGLRTCTWNGKDSNGNIVGDGTYRVYMELSENPGTGKSTFFTFTKGSVADVQAPASQSNFSSVSLKWTPQ